VNHLTIHKKNVLHARAITLFDLEKAVRQKLTEFFTVEAAQQHLSQLVTLDWLQKRHLVTIRTANCFLEYKSLN
jgi:hypothetical protein